MTPFSPEQQARQHIDELLAEADLVVQDFRDVNLGVSLGVAVREYPTDAGPAGYALFVDRRPVGTVEAKKESTLLSSVVAQSEKYALSKLTRFERGDPLPFVYESTGVVTNFRDYRDPKPRSRPVFTFHRPETFGEWIKEGSSVRAHLLDLPVLHVDDLRECQVRAITNHEKSFKSMRPRALIQMATGSGKTFTAISSVYRLLRYSKAQRILFLVDTRNLGEQAEGEFLAYTPRDDKRMFTELYSVQRLSSSYIDPSSQVCISTIQRMFSILKDEEADDNLDAVSMYERKWEAKEPVIVKYNAKLPIETLDFIIIDECHRSIYNYDTFRSCEIVTSTARMSLMNLFLYNIGDMNSEPPITRSDSLLGLPSERYDYVLTNPLFGKKSIITVSNDDGTQVREALTYNRQDFWTTTSNKQLNFVQYVCSMLKVDVRTAVVVPDNVLFESGSSETVRKLLLEMTNLHTILRLPTVIFYAQGVKANVIFWTISQQ